MANAEQISNWDGPAGEHWVREQDRFDRMLAPYTDVLLGAAALAPGERVLDVGCGTGALAVAAAATGAQVTGLDVSAPMLAAAERRAAAAGVEVEWVQGDAQVHPFPAGTYDAVVSRFGVMFFDDPAAAFANLAGAMRPGGRLAVTCWQDVLRNGWITVPVSAALAHVPMPQVGAPGAPGPFAFADPDRVRGLLAAAGLADVTVEERCADLRMGATVDDVVDFFERTEIGRDVIGRAEPPRAAAAWVAVRAALDERMTPDGVVLGGAAWLVRARRPTSDR